MLVYRLFREVTLHSRGVKCNFTKQPVDQHRLINLYNTCNNININTKLNKRRRRRRSEGKKHCMDNSSQELKHQRTPGDG